MRGIAHVAKMIPAGTAAALLAGGAWAQDFGTATASGGGTGALGTGPGVLQTDAVAGSEVDEAEPGILGTDAVAGTEPEPGPAGAGTVVDDGAADGPITGITELPADLGEEWSFDDLDAWQTDAAEAPESDGIGAAEPGEEFTREAAVVEDEPAIIRPDRPVLLAPGEIGTGVEADSQTEDDAPMLDAGVGGDVEPQTIEVGTD